MSSVSLAYKMCFKYSSATHNRTLGPECPLKNVEILGKYQIENKLDIFSRVYQRVQLLFKL